MNRVVVVGGVGLDVVVRTSRLPVWGDDLRVAAVGGRPGGKGLNQSVALARLGGVVRTVAAIGDDAVGRDLLAALAAEGVDSAGMVVRPGAATPICLVLSHPDGRNAFCWRIAEDLALTAADVRASSVEASIRAADAVLVNFDPLLPVVRAVFETAAAVGTPLVVNPGPPPDVDEARLAAAVTVLPWRHVGLATPNEKEARLLLGAVLGEPAAAAVAASDLADLFATTFGVPNVCVTLSERGCVVRDAAGSRVYPARPTRVVDTTAASDALTAALTLGMLADGWRGGARVVPAAVVDRALAAASWTVARQGAFDALPTAADLDRSADLDSSADPDSTADLGSTADPDSRADLDPA